jgi:hypothetical protein
MSTKKEPAPPQNRPSPNTNGYSSDFTRLLALQRHDPLDAETRGEIELLAKAAEMGFRLATRCTRCNQWIVAPSSVRRHMGAVCAKKAVQA